MQQLAPGFARRMGEQAVTNEAAVDEEILHVSPIARRLRRPRQPMQAQPKGTATLQQSK